MANVAPQSLHGHYRAETAPFLYANCCMLMIFVLSVAALLRSSLYCTRVASIRVRRMAGLEISIFRILLVGVTSQSVRVTHEHYAWAAGVKTNPFHSSVPIAQHVSIHEAPGCPTDRISILPPSSIYLWYGTYVVYSSTARRVQVTLSFKIH